MNESYMDIHLELLLERDSHFKALWTELTDEERRDYLGRLQKIISSHSESGEILETLHTSMTGRTKRWFLRIQEKPFEYSRIPENWATIARSTAAKQQIFKSMSAWLSEVVNSAPAVDDIVISGGIKPDESIKRKLFKKRDGDAVQRNVVDIWDLFRFRLTTQCLDDLLKMGLFLWESLFESVIRCRNFYYRPRNDFPGDSYRAIHFELADKDGALVELQMMTRNREVVSLVDHAFLFKRVAPFVDKGHEDWLKELSMKANLLDGRDASGPEDLLLVDGDRRTDTE